MKQNKYAFTLVELIVVITIIAILGTIAFITMQGYSASSRDSVRISDMSKISSSLELFNIDAGKYPDPTQAQPVTYNGGLAWYQGIFGDATFTNVSRLDKIPTDPLTEKEYAYSVLNTKQEFELGSIIEGDELALNTSNEVNAFEKTAKAKITGTYNGISLRVNANNTSYVLAIPSIITSIDLAIEANRGLEIIIPANEMVLDNYSNLPSNYIGTSYDSNKETTNPDFKIVNNILLYEGDIKNLTPTILITKLQEAYSGTTVALTDATTELFQINVTSGLELEKIDNYGKNFINNNLGGSAESRIYNTCEGIPHNTMKSYYSAVSVLFGISCDTVKKDFICIDGTWTDTPTGANILDYPETECVVEEALNCTYLETPINHGDSITVYSQETLVWNGIPNCTDPGIQGTVTCNNGVNQGDTTFAYKTCTKGTPTNCTADSSYELNGHTYDVIQMNHDVSSTPTVDISENHGIFRYTFNALCNDGLITGNETGPVNLSCNTNYTWNDLTNECEADTKTYTCSAKPANTLWNTVGSYIQTWNGTDWLPEDTTTIYNVTSTTNQCGYICDISYHTENGGVSCISDTKSCIMENGIGKQTRNGSSWGICTVESCNTGYAATVDSCEKNSLMDNIIGYWDFDEGSGQITKDKLGNGNNLNVYNDINTDVGSWVSGKVGGGAYQLHGSGWLATTGLNLLSQAKTVSFWYKLPDTSDLMGTLVSFYNSSNTNIQDNLYQDYVGGTYGSAVCTTYYSSLYKYGKAINDTNWHFYSISKGTDTIICIDGICDNTGIDSISGISIPSAITLNGGLGCGFGEFTQGLIIDELRINSVSFTKSQLEQAYLDGGGVANTIVDFNGAKRYSNGAYATSCKDYLNSQAYSNNGSGIYWIRPDTTPVFKVYCDMINDGGGWTLAGNSKEVDYNGTTILNDNALGDITNINTTTTAKLTTNNINSILFGGDRKIRIDNFDNNKYIIEYSANQTISFTQYKSYNLRLTHNGKTSIFYDSHPNFILLAGISSDTFVSSLCPSGCRQTFGMEYTDGIVGDYGWKPNLRRSGGVNPAPVSNNFYNFKLWLK